MWTDTEQKKTWEWKKVHEKVLSRLLVIWKMLIKTTTRLYHTPTRMAKMKIIDHTKYQRGCGASGILIHCWWERKIVHSLKIVWKFLKKHTSILWPRNLISRYLPKEMKTHVHKRPHTRIFRAALFTVALDSKLLITVSWRTDSSKNGILLSSKKEQTIDNICVWTLKTVHWVKSQMSSFRGWMTGKGPWGFSGIKQTNNILRGERVVTQMYIFVKRDWNYMHFMYGNYTSFLKSWHKF